MLIVCLKYMEERIKGRKKENKGRIKKWKKIDQQIVFKYYAQVSTQINNRLLIVKNKRKKPTPHQRQKERKLTE